MLRFDSPKQPAPRNYLARREQLRLLLMVASLCLVGILAWQVRSPGSRALLARLFGGEAQPAPADAAPDGQAGRAASLGATRQWLNPVQLESIRDNAVFRSAETDAWFAILAQLKAQDQPLAASDATPVGYAQLAAQPQAYRGRTVLVRGEIKRVEPQTPAANELGIERLYRVIFRPRGDEVWPIAVYVLAPPAEIEFNTEVSRPATAVGVFFKNQSYQSQAGAGTMPVVLARKVDPASQTGSSSRTPPAPVEQSDLLTMAAIAAAVAAVIVVLVLRASRGMSKPKPNG